MRILVPIFVPILSVIGSLGLAAAADPPGEWHDLFDGKTLDGWRLKENPSTFSIRDGAIVARGPRSHLFYAGPVGGHDFGNFEVLAEILTKPGANSGLYIHTEYQATGWPAKGYEIQINNTFTGGGTSPEVKKTGSIYAVRNLYVSTVKDDEWFTMHIIVNGKRVRVLLNGTLVIDYREPAQPIRSAGWAGRVLSHGTIALQGHDPGSETRFRRIRVKFLPADAGDDARPGPADDPRVARLLDSNFPLVDFHAHLKGGLTIDEVLAKSRASGIQYGVALNCGVGFPVTDDAGLRSYLDQLEGKPVYKGMQAEGREWVTLVSREAVSAFDYVFTDAMTLTDDKGRRMRLWMPDEVRIDEKQAFMDMLVERIVTILRTEPIDIYANATYLPAPLAAEYDALWTPARMQKVIRAAVENGVAIEIGARMRLPRLPFLRMAKAAGATFSFGTNNGGRNDLGDLSYCLEMVDAVKLTETDMFRPKPRGKRPIDLRPGAVKPAAEMGK